MVTKVLVAATIALGAAVGVAAPALADPSTDSVYGCACLPPAEKVSAPAPDPGQMTQVIQQTLSDLEAN